jgi:hypothetical protein
MICGLDMERAMNCKGFDVLQASATVASEDILASIKDYAASGAGISSQVVISIIARTALSESDLAHRDLVKVGTYRVDRFNNHPADQPSVPASSP